VLRPTERRLRSDFLLVRYPGGDATWMAFRDVGQVDEKVLHHDQNRLIRLFARPDAAAASQAADIARESFRYHLPGGSFAVTNPLVGMALMHPEYQARLRFTLGGEERSMGSGARAIRFQERDERKEPAVEALFGPAGRVRGSVWVETASGRILKTDTRFLGRSPATSGTSTTTFVCDERLGVVVPSEMKTAWSYSNTLTVSGTATYGQFRRFDVQTETGTVRPRSSGSGK
jgi:hypothetical protein